MTSPAEPPPTDPTPASQVTRPLRELAAFVFLGANALLLFVGLIRLLAPQGAYSTVTGRAVVQNLRSRMWPGELVFLSVQAGVQRGVLAVPTPAIQTGQQVGMQTLDQCLQDYVTKGIVSKEEARYKAQNKETI